MKVLGIETSCDETAVCLIEGTGSFGPEFTFKILGNALSSQADLHAQYGGVFPNLAKREHGRALVPLLEQVLKEAGMLKSGKTAFNEIRLCELLEREEELLALLLDHFTKHAKPDIDAIAVTYGPGLEPALWVGVNFARALSLFWNVPLVAVNHMEGHILLSMTEKGWLAEHEFPLLALLISGGHTELVVSKEFGSYTVVGQTRDDAAGEAFDKVARMLGLPYPGGPEISKLASEARAKSLQTEEKLTRPMLHDDSFDFSFSGLKTAMRKRVEALSDPSLEDKQKLAREFEDTVADVLVEKTLRAIDRFGINTVVVGGGVSANTYIRSRLAEALAEEGNVAKLLVPPPELATDNALMIALAGYFHALNKEFADNETLSAYGNLKLGEN